MRPSKTTLSSYQSMSKLEMYKQFRHRDSDGRNRFVIGATEASALLRATNARKIDNVPGYSKSDAIILEHSLGFRELYVNPSLQKYRDAHKAFLDAILVEVRESQFEHFDSDHVFPKSASTGHVGLVKMCLVAKSVNRAHGAGPEKRATHHRAEDCIKRGQLISVMKVCNIPMFDPRDPIGSMKRAVEQMLALGIAPTRDRDFLVGSVDECRRDLQTQDENYADDLTS